MQIIAGIIGVVAYGFLIYAIVKSNAKQSFAAFLLWGMLDGIATITTYLEHGNFWLPFSNVAGSTVVTIILIRKKQFSWTWIETITAVLVAACLVVWAAAGETPAIVASSLAVVIASVPQFKETWDRPEATPKVAYTIFLIANVLSFFAGEDWSLKERFYSACSVFLTAVILGFSFKNGNQTVKK